MTVIIKQQFISSHLIWQKLTQLQDKFLFLCVTNQERYWHFTENTIKNDENDACFCSFWTIWQLMWAFYPLANEVAKGYSNATCYAVKIWPGDLDLWPGKSIGFQILLSTKYVPSLIKIHWRMLILERSQGCDGRTEGRTVALLYPFATSLARG
jgi:hypothetical protein